MQIIFQDPFSSLNPRMTVIELIAEGLRHTSGLNTEEKELRVAEIMDAVGLDDSFKDRFPHEMSGGQRQRIAIARAIVARPKFVVADEPVSALDVTVQAQILILLKSLQKRYGFTCLFISHDLGVVESICDRVAVMYQGQILEEAGANQLFHRPFHPYTCHLMNAVPLLVKHEDGGYRLRTHEWEPPELPGANTYFSSEGMMIHPVLIPVEDQHMVAVSMREND